MKYCPKGWVDEVQTKGGASVDFSGIEMADLSVLTVSEPEEVVNFFLLRGMMAQQVCSGSHESDEDFSLKRQQLAKMKEKLLRDAKFLRFAAISKELGLPQAFSPGI